MLLERCWLTHVIADLHQMSSLGHYMLVECVFSPDRMHNLIVIQLRMNVNATCCLCLNLL
jgi:hypothetical protein